MKKFGVIMGIIAAMFLTACAGETEKKPDDSFQLETWSEPDGSLLVDEEKKYTDPPQTWPVVDEISQEPSHAGGELDAVLYSQNGLVTELNDVIYTIGIDTFHLCRYDTETKTKGVVCNRPDCSHNTADCSGYAVLVTEVQAYDGKLYYVAMESGEKGENSVEKAVLYAVLPDGSGKDAVQTLCTVEHENSSDSNVSYSMGCRFIIHQGYVYYWYKIADSRSSYDTWRNGNACLYRTRLGAEPGQEECVFAFPKLEECSDVYLYPYGDYIYCAVSDNPFMDITGTLYRFNLKEKRTERLSATEKAYMMEVFPQEEEVVYTATSEDGSCVVKSLDLRTGESQVIYDSTKETGHSLDVMNYDGTYWYITSYTRAEDGYSIISQDYYVLDEDFQILGMFERPENTMFATFGLTSDIVFFNEWGGIAAWVDKSGFEKGDFTVHMK